MLKWRTIGKYFLFFSLFTAIFTAITLAVFFPYVSYFLADYQYERIVRMNPQTKTEVERLLFLCRSRQIDIKESSLWYYSLKPGEECYQYLVLGREPIEAVYYVRGNLKTIFCSYE